MRLKFLALGMVVATAVPAAVATAQAEDGIYVPFFTYRTGPYSGSGIPVANGLSDYMTMLNPGRVLTRAQLLDHVWEYDFGGSSTVVSTYVAYLRRKLARYGPM